tara:strand:- start:1064 stop:2161 length:1098 start_codon:yes stop_codon:yes gene_type:complete
MNKILIVSNSLWNVENFRKKIILKFLELNYKVDIVVPYDKSFIGSISHKNLTIIYLNFKAKTYISFIDLIFVFKLLKYIKINKPNFVLSFTVKPNLICSFFSKFLNYKCICNITGLGTLFLRGNLVKKIAITLYSICLRNVYHVLFHNIQDKKLFLENSIILEQSSSVIPGSGVDLKFFKYSIKKYFKNQKINFLYLGRIMKDKGIFEYLQAIKLIKSNKLNVKFTFAGKLDTKNKTLLNIFKKFIRNQYIIYLEEVKDVRSLINMCDCLVLPSYREGLSKTLLEASAIGRPLLVSNVPGCNDIVEEGYNGLLFESQNYKSLQRCLLKFINLSENEKEQMAKNSHNISSLFNDEIVMNKYLELVN